MDKDKMFKLMKFWLFGTFLILFSSTTLYVGKFIGLALFKTWEYWATMAFAALASWLGFVLYKSYLDKQ